MITMQSFAGSALFAACCVSSLGAQERGDGEARRENAKAYIEQRANASGVIPDDALYNAWRDVTSLPRTAFAFADQGWRSVGPAGLTLAQEAFGGVYAAEIKSGRINGIAIHPQNGRTILIGSQGGVWRTTTAGHLWSATTDDHCSTSIGSVKYDPVNASLAYALTGEANGFTQIGCGVIRSGDGGQNWIAPGNSPLVGSHGYELLIDRATAGSISNTKVLAATNRGLYLSVNSGASWVQVLDGFVTSVVQHPTVSNIMYANRSVGGGSPTTAVHRSINGGVTWAPLPAFVPGGVVARVTLAVTASAPDLLFALAGNFSDRSFIGVFRWNNGTGQWFQTASSGVETTGNNYPYTIGRQMDYDQALAVDPRTPNRIWIGGVGAYFSQDGGQSFQTTANNIHVDWHHIGFDPSDPDHMVAGTDGGFFQSYDGGRIWRASNVGLAITQIYPGMAVHPSGQWLYAGLQDNNAIYFTGSPVWNNLSFLGDGGWIAVNPTNPSTIFVTHSFAGFITRRINGGKEMEAGTGIPQNDRHGLPRPIIMDPTAPSTLYYGTQRLFRTTNEAAQWSAITTDATRGSGFITTIAVAPSDPNVIYAGTNDGVIIVTYDGGSSFRQFVFGTQRRFSRITVDPNDPLHAIATATTLGAPKMTETRDGAQTFNTSIGNSLPDVPVHTSFFVPGSPMIMIGTDYGVLTTVNGGMNWLQGPPGLPNTIVHDLVYSPASGTVFAATFARGAYAIRLGATPAVRRGDVDNDGILTAQDALTIQRGIVGIHPPPGSILYPNGDANCDGRLTSADPMLVLRGAVGLPTTGTCAGTLAAVASRSQSSGHDPTTMHIMPSVGQ